MIGNLFAGLVPIAALMAAALGTILFIIAVGLLRQEILRESEKELLEQAVPVKKPVARR